MKFKHFFLLILMILIGFVVIYWITINYDLLIKQNFFFTKKLAVPTWLAIFIFFMTGFFLMGILFLIDALKKTRKIHKLVLGIEEKKYFEEGIEIAVYNFIQGEIEEAKNILENLPKEKADLPEAKILKLCIYLKEKEIEKAEKILRELELEGKPAFLPLIKSSFYELKQENEKAIEVAENTLKTIPEILKRIALKNLRNLYIKNNKFEKALDIQMEILKHNYNEKENQIKICLMYEKAKKLKNEGKIKETISLIQDILKENKKFAPAWVLFGDIYKEEKEEEKALSVYTEGFKNTYSAILIHRIEDLYLEKEEVSKALEAINHLRFQVEKEIIPKFFLGKLYYRLEVLDEAYKFLSSIQPFAPNSVVLNYMLSNLEERLGKKEKALSSLRKAVSSYDALKNEYLCFNCQKSFSQWFDRCPNCGAWASIELNFKEEISEDTLGLKVQPISYPVY